MRLQTITNNQLCSCLNGSWWTVLLLRNTMEMTLPSEEEVELRHSSSLSKIHIYYMSIQKIQKNQVEISSGKILIFTCLLYFSPVCFQVLMRDTWNVEVPVKVFKTEVGTKACIFVIHRWEFDLNVRTCLSRKMSLLLMGLCNVLWKTSVGLIRGLISRHWNLNSCCIKQWWGHLWDSLCSNSPYLKNWGSSYRYW